jgi:hypothetical protein
LARVVVLNLTNMQIKTLINEIKESNLTKDELEKYSSMLDILSAEIELELADVEKAGALFLANCGEKTRAGATTKWDASELGQKEIELKKSLRAVNKLTSSVKTRIYQKY